MNTLLWQPHFNAEIMLRHFFHLQNSWAPDSIIYKIEEMIENQVNHTLDPLQPASGRILLGKKSLVQRIITLLKYIVTVFCYNFVEKYAAGRNCLGTIILQTTAKIKQTILSYVSHYVLYRFLQEERPILGHYLLYLWEHSLEKLNPVIYEKFFQVYSMDLVLKMLQKHWLDIRSYWAPLKMYTRNWFLACSLVKHIFNINKKNK